MFLWYINNEQVLKAVFLLAPILFLMIKIKIILAYLLWQLLIQKCNF